jgi:hypothetical protein
VAHDRSQSVLLLDGNRARLPDGELLSGIHPVESCVSPCVFHSPSDHSLTDRPLMWRVGHGLIRTCKHGETHPDPDTPQGKKHRTTCPCCCFVISEMY